MTPETIAAVRARTAAFSPDPFGDGSASATTPWLYGPAQYELAVLDRLVREGFAAGRNVHYARNYAPVTTSARLRMTAEAGQRIPFTSTAAVVTVSGADLRDGVLHAGGGEILLDLKSDEGPIALIDSGIEWQWIGANGAVPLRRRRGSTTPPHLLDEPSVELQPASLGEGVFDAGATVLGRVVLSAAGDARPSLTSGESLAEALDEGTPEARHDLVRLDSGEWATVHRLGFRYLRVSGAHHVRIEATVHPTPRRGAFACSDDILTRIWATSAYTVRTCMQGLNLDGVKRDRMPWAGDQAASLASTSFAFGDARIVTDSLVALGRPTSGYINGLADYSLWWLIAQAGLRRHFGDVIPLAEHADDVHRFLVELAVDLHEGVFRPRDLGHFGGAGAVLIDWGVHPEPGRDLTALQVLLVWALDSAAALLAEAGHPATDRWRAAHAAALAVLTERGWDADAGHWRKYLDPEAGASAYPNLLAVLAGLHDDVPATVAAALDVDQVRTPYMTGFALAALGLAGHRTEALAHLRKLWTPMLDAGATTFWEEFAHDGETPYAMYGRPFGKSLCHGWGAAPAALLPELVLGIRPTAEGWSEVEVDPQLGDLDWAAAVVPTPHGDLFVRAEGADVHVEAPEGVRVVVRTAGRPDTVAVPEITTR